MNNLYSQWKKDEQTPFSGWDFSYIKDRLKVEKPPWNYEKEVNSFLKQQDF